MKIRVVNRDHNLIRSNKGSTLITVIVAIAFVTILTSIILGTTVMNVRMKGIDKQTKDDFYKAEKAMNDIYTGIGEHLAEKAGEYYEDAFERVGTENGGVDYHLAEEASKKFRLDFCTYAGTYLQGLGVTGLEKFIEPKIPADRIDGEAVEGVGSDVIYQDRHGDSKPLGTPLTAADEKTARIVLPNVRVSSTDKSGFRTVIMTDIVINVPHLDFLGSNVDVSDYGLIANKGLYITGGDGVNNGIITGNVYAGIHEFDSSIDDEEYYEFNDAYSKKDKKALAGGINILGKKVVFKSNYIVSKGDINLSGTKPQLKVYTPSSEDGANLANLWFTSLRTISTASLPEQTEPEADPETNPTIDINANVFAFNDLAINADNSSIRIKGNYYGYNDKTLVPLGERTDKTREEARNSAIIINGSKAYLDMKEINNFVLMGKAYIDFTSDRNTIENSTNDQVVPTAEGVALKTNQQLYLMPPDFLVGANPVEVEAGDYEFLLKISKSELEKWFGYDFLDTSVAGESSEGNPDPPAKSIHNKYNVSSKVKLADDTETTRQVFYDYLVFDEREGEDNNWMPTYDVGSLGTETKDEKYIVKKKPDGSYQIDKYTRSGDTLGTGGSISSKAMFFLKIMMAENAYEYTYSQRALDSDERARNMTKLSDYIDYKEEGMVQPSEYRLYQRIKLSMGYGYFDLSQCVVGNRADPGEANYYAKNAVVNYEKATVIKDDGRSVQEIQSNVLDNTKGMLRYAGYPGNLYNRYKWLCTQLNGKEDNLLETDPLDPDAGKEDAKKEWKISTDAPLSHFVDKSLLNDRSVSAKIGDADEAGLKIGAYGVVVPYKGKLVIKTGADGSIPGEFPSDYLVSSKTFKGVAIVDGDIVVGENVDIDGLLIATGTITLSGNNNVTYDRGLIQSRIDKEMDLIRKDESVDGGYKDYHLINYLIRIKPNGMKVKMYDVTPGTRKEREEIEADYNDFMHYENWKKSE